MVVVVRTGSSHLSDNTAHASRRMAATTSLSHHHRSLVYYGAVIDMIVRTISLGFLVIALPLQCHHTTTTLPSHCHRTATALLAKYGGSRALHSLRLTWMHLLCAYTTGYERSDQASKSKGV
jgi:hypothetical protein